MRWIHLALAIVVLSFIAGLLAYRVLPDQIVSHWGANGEPNGWAPKETALFLVPIISLILIGLFFAIPRIDPLKYNVAKFRNYYEGFIVMLTGFFFYLQLVTIAFNMGFRFNMIQVLAPAFAVLFYYISILLKHAKRNWFIGIRTPWTMSSDLIWDKTHKFGSLLAKIVALGCLLAFFIPQQAILLIVGTAVFFGLATIVYSYLEFRKLPLPKTKRRK